MANQNRSSAFLYWYLVLALLIGSSLLGGFAWVPDVPSMMIALVVSALIPAMLFATVGFLVGIVFGWIIQACKMSVHCLRLFRGGL